MNWYKTAQLNKDIAQKIAAALYRKGLLRERDDDAKDEIRQLQYNYVVEVINDILVRNIRHKFESEESLGIWPPATVPEKPLSGLTGPA